MLGAWAQGEVAGNYAGPFNTNAVIQHVALKVKPAQAVTLGALFFDYQTVSTHGLPNLNGRELDLYAEWAVNEHLIVTPLLSLYKPERDQHNAGNQVGEWHQRVQPTDSGGAVLIESGAALRRS